MRPTHATEDTAEDTGPRMEVTSIKVVAADEALLETRVAAEEVDADPEVVAVAETAPVEAAPAPVETPAAGL